MKKTQVILPSYPFSIDYTSKSVFLGSCFSEHLSGRMQEHGFDVLSNPLGVVFNPLSIADFVRCSTVNNSMEDTILRRDDVFLSWLANSKIHAYSKRDLANILVEKANSLKQAITTADVLFLTFGTAWVYSLVDNNQVVGNCHKFPVSTFHKRCLSVEEVSAAWEGVIDLVRQQNPELKVVLTISPVRHIKDGLSENQQSKAVLKLACTDLMTAIPNVYYFPAYEIVIDELRDYAFFEADGVHPNKFAIDEITQRFLTSFLDVKSQEIWNECTKLKRDLEHKPIHPSAQASLKFSCKLQERLNDFKQQHPYLAHVFK